MGRLLLIAIALVVVIWLVRRAVAGPRRGGNAADGPPSAAAGDLVSCAHCGVNLPKAEARSAGGRFYCSEDHWRLGPRDS